MKFKLISLTIFSLIIFVTLAKLAYTSDSSTPWFNSSWHFRIPINVTNSTQGVVNASVKINVNFTYLLNQLGIIGTFDPNYIRILEDNYEHSYDWINDTSANDKGNVSWIANGTTSMNTNRTFWIYFDVVENGAKQTGKIISEKPYWQSSYTNSMNVWSNQSASPGIGYEWNRSWAKSLEVSWKWCTERYYDFAYLYVDSISAKNGPNSDPNEGNTGTSGSGSETVQYVGSRISTRFKSDSSGYGSEVGCSSSYGTAVDWIKFYETTNYTTPVLTINQGSAEIQPLSITVQTNKSSYKYNETMKISGNVKNALGESVNTSSVDIGIFYPNQTQAYFNTLQTNSSGDYLNQIIANWSTPGIYSVNVTAYKFSYANATNSTNFTYIVGPEITIYVTNKSEQFQPVQINTTVKDVLGVGINWTKINVTMPNGTITQNNMIKISEVGTESNWTIWYNGTWGNTSLRGIYNVTVYSMDNVSNIGTSNTSFKVYALLNVTIQTQKNTYYQGDTGRIKYLIGDANENPLSNVSVTSKIINPNGTLIWNETGITDQNGTIEPLPTFELTSDDPIGQYTLYSFTNFYDSLSNITISKENNYNFSVQEKPAAIGILTLDLEAPTEIATGNNLSISATVTDGTKNTDVDSAKANLYNSLGILVLGNIPMIRTDTGVYYLSYNTSAWTQGIYKWTVTVTKGSNTLEKEIFTNLIGGPFDVKNITIVNNTIPNLVINVTIENTGSAEQDVNVEWNLTRLDTGSSLASGLDTIKISALSTVTHTVNPSTTYVGDVKITFLLYYSGTEKAGAYKTFSTSEAVTPPVVPPTTPPSAGPSIIVSITPRLKIVSYPEEVEIERGWLGYADIKVNNTGGTILNNVQTLVTGIPSDWVEIEPQVIDVLNPNNSKDFAIKIAVPINAESGNYPTKVKVFSNETSDEEIFIIRVFASRAELIFYQIQTIKENLYDLGNRTAQAEIAGKNVTLVKSILDDARGRLRTAQDYLDKNMYNESSNFVRVTRDLLDEAEYELSVATPTKAPILVIELLQYWLLIIVGLLIAIIGLIVYLLRRTRALERIKVQVPDLGKLVLGKRILADLQKEKEKIEKFLTLIESEHIQGIISKESYEELRSKNQEKLNEIERKLETA